MFEMYKTLDDNATAAEAENPEATSQGRDRLLVVGGILGAIIASSCCVVPLLLITLGVSGAWIGNLTALEPYKAYFIAVTVVILSAGFWYIYIKPKKACAEGSYCARPESGRITKIVLWFATVLVLINATVNYWAPLFY